MRPRQFNQNLFHNHALNQNCINSSTPTIKQSNNHNNHNNQTIKQSQKNHNNHKKITKNHRILKNMSTRKANARYICDTKLAILPLLVNFIRRDNSSSSSSSAVDGSFARHSCCSIIINIIKSTSKTLHGSYLITLCLDQSVDKSAGVFASDGSGSGDRKGIDLIDALLTVCYQGILLLYFLFIVM
jgi:hypothetical protein